MFNLTPWRAKKLPVHQEESSPLYTLQQQVNELFDQYFGESTQDPFNLFPTSLGEHNWGDLSPKIDMSETDKELIVKAEMPGISEKDIDITVSDNTLKIYAEKKQENQETEKGWYRMERQYGSFARSISLPYEVDSNKVEATYKHGVVKIVLPKMVTQKTEERLIPIKTSPA